MLHSLSAIPPDDPYIYQMFVLCVCGGMLIVFMVWGIVSFVNWIKK